MSKQFTLILICFVLLTASCRSSVEEAAQILLTPTAALPIPSNTAYTCADIDSQWGNNWPAVISVLDYLINQGQMCGEEPLLSKKYAAHFSYASLLEVNGELDAAISQYTTAFSIDANRVEALDALIRLDALPEATAVPCHSDLAPLPDPSPSEQPDQSSFVQVQGDKLTLHNQPYQIKGVNYYPRQAPWHQFLSESDLSEVAAELDLIKQAGFNSIRIFFWYEPLFICQPEDAIPNEAMFAKTDAFIQLAKERDLRLIITLNDLPDLIFRPLYTDWERYDAQTRYIVRRYQNESAIIAWDLRNEGDLDYGAREGDAAEFSQDEVISWLAHSSALVRENDSYHLLTAGWWGDPSITEPFVDFLSFHHWYDTLSLQVRINRYSQSGEKPILLEEIGYHSWLDAPQDKRSEAEQAQLLGNAVALANAEEIAGWMIWTAFDFVPKAGQSSTYEHNFGLWRTDLTPKPALSQIFEN
ncbi:MAG: cellulase family glycosylhydrolase [Chloroflexi bacterium]|nr:cellulase family glycosylhydrolase [Chloroflexota bacterium]